MKTIVSNEDAVWQEAGKDARVLSVVRSGELYRFVIEAMVVQPEANGLETYTYPEEIHRSGLYDTKETARDAACRFPS
jgi:hypothetical protein